MAVVEFDDSLDWLKELLGILAFIVLIPLILFLRWAHRDY